MLNCALHKNQQNSFIVKYLNYKPYTDQVKNRRSPNVKLLKQLKHIIMQATCMYIQFPALNISVTAKC